MSHSSDTAIDAHAQEKLRPPQCTRVGVINLSDMARDLPWCLLSTFSDGLHGCRKQERSALDPPVLRRAVQLAIMFYQGAL